ncbi:hypothetical protein K440DRAFT_371972 [Wilcoxina mikolae CBS 423.85]|nr:hypothetical protein K440DRAFT_371972 [Wilcoxina mikolae CBS 423.85]
MVVQTNILRDCSNFSRLLSLTYIKLAVYTLAMTNHRHFYCYLLWPDLFHSLVLGVRVHFSLTFGVAFDLWDVDFDCASASAFLHP